MHAPAVQYTAGSFVYRPGQEAAKSGPKDNTKLGNVLWSLSSLEILAPTKVSVMQQAVEKCPKVSIACKGVQMPSLLDLG